MVSANEGPCAQCIVSVQHDDEVKDGKRTIEQLVSEITGRLENDGVLAERSRLLPISKVQWSDTTVPLAERNGRYITVKG